MAEPEWISAAEAARRLGIKQATLYSYVSRGVLTRRRASPASPGRGGGAAGRAPAGGGGRDDGARGGGARGGSARDDGARGGGARGGGARGGGASSLFDPAEVEELARRGRPRRPPGLAGLVIESGVTEIGEDRLWFRGLDALDLARDQDFEAVCELLWGVRPGPDPGWPGPGCPWPGRGGVAGGRRGAGGGHRRPGRPPARHLPAGTAPGHRPGAGRRGSAAAAVRPAGRGRGGPGHHRGPGGLPAAGRGRESAGRARGREPGSGGRAGAGHQPAATGIPARLWPKLSPDDPPPGLLDALRAALILLADHELAASTLAARVAASVRADPYAVVATGLGAVGGALHGGASLGAETMLAAAPDAASVPRVVGDLLRRGERVPGFGHFVYRGGDPRAGLLLAMVRRAVPASPRLAVVDAVLAEMHRRSLPEPNIDFALAVLASCAGMIRGAGEVIFAVARTAGWLAHALEEYTARTPLRPRAVYTGPSHH